MTKKSPKSRSRSSSAGRKSTTKITQDEEPQQEDPQPPPVDGQKLTLSDQDFMDIDLELTLPRNLSNGAIEGTSFIPEADDDDEEGGEEEGEDGIIALTSEMLENALSNLNYIADGTQLACLNLSIPGHGIQNISILESYIHLQKVELQYNNLDDLSPLSCMTRLVELDVSHNEIKNLLDFKPPFNLREVNFAHNEIEEIPNLLEFKSLGTLNLDHNHIVEIHGLENCKSLKTLTLAYNRIEKIQGLEGLNLFYLTLGHNSITTIEGIEALSRIHFLDLSGNQITSMSGLDNHSILHELDLEDNNIGSIDEIVHIKDLSLLRKLNLMRNPIVELEQYRMSVLFQVPQITELDRRSVQTEEKVAATNLFAAPPELQAALDHITHTVYNFLQPKKIYECTLPNIAMPYPMLVLTGPQASGKRELCHRLVQEFPDFFGYGVSHTTKMKGPNEVDMKDYIFTSKEDFHNLVRQGAFIQTCKISNAYYGLSMDAIENVAKEGLACVVHMEIEGVRTLKNTHFEPRYVLVMPFDSDNHSQKMKDRGYTDDEEIHRITKLRANMYKEINLNNPGYFDMTISSDKLAEAYDRLRQLVMDYLGMSEAADQVGGANQQMPLSTTMHKDETNTQQTNTSGNMRRTWSRPSFIVDSTGSNDALSSKHIGRTPKTPVEEASYRRRENAAKEAIEGTPQMAYYEAYYPRPMVPMTAPAIMEGSPMTQAASMYQDPSFIASTLYPTAGKLLRPDLGSDTSSETGQDVTSSLSGLSSARDFSETEMDKKKDGLKLPVLPPLSSGYMANEPLDLSALSDALESLKGSLEGVSSQRAETPLTPRSPRKESMNIKPVLPPINAVANKLQL